MSNPALRLRVPLLINFKQLIAVQQTPLKGLVLNDFNWKKILLHLLFCLQSITIIYNYSVVLFDK